jgi:hypothetical protein
MGLPHGSTVGTFAADCAAFQQTVIRKDIQVTIAEARAHFRERLELVEDERTMIIMGLKNREFWSKSEGAEAAIPHLEQLVGCFKRILHVIDVHEAHTK